LAAAAQPVAGVRPSLPPAPPYPNLPPSPATPAFPPNHPPSFANKYRGFYHKSGCANAANFYDSKSYNDDLAWAALWLKAATGDKGYLRDARQ
jgi:hypothetical protein